jgi:leucyl aminopeptidase (aminopeptidase T)
MCRLVARPLLVRPREERLALAEVAVVVGANVQPGQVVQITAEVDQLELARAPTDAAYRRGAGFVDVQFRDPVLRRSLVLYGPAEAYVPAWRDAHIYGLDDVQGARIRPRMSGYRRWVARTACAWVVSIHISHRPDPDWRSSRKR